MTRETEIEQMYDVVCEVPIWWGLDVYRVALACGEAETKLPRIRKNTIALQ